MLAKAIQDALNDQLKHELYAANLYLSLAAYCDSVNLPGFANWMRVQATEENGHAMKLYHYINDRDGRVVMPAVDQPPVEFSGPVDVFQQALEHERRVTESYNKHLYPLVQQEQDYATQLLVDWFVNEQVEEEKTARQSLEQVKMAGQDAAALLMLDRELAQRRAGAHEEGSA